MAASANHPQNLSERLIAWTIAASWGLWLVGGLYVAGPMLGWALGALVAAKLYLASGLPPSERVRCAGFAVRVWLGSMAAMLVVLLIGHANFDLGAAATLKSSIGWAKGWALLALFPLAGAVLDVRTTLIYRSVCRLGRQTLFVLPVLLVAPYVGLPETLWTSPLKILGGASDEFFAVVLYTLEPGVGTARWQFFAPWSPAAGLVGVIYLLCAIEEKDWRWRATGSAASIAMILMSQSRLAIVAAAIAWPLAFVMSRLNRAGVWFAAVPVVLVGSWFWPSLLSLIDKVQTDFAGARADSSRVRATLGRIAVERWEHEAYWFGHGIVERGPHLVEYMPIGSHHSWYGLLFVKGLAGLCALAIPLAVTVVACASASLKAQAGRVGLSMAVVYLLYSFGENLEVVSYLCWPALLLIGIALRVPDGSERTPAML